MTGTNPLRTGWIVGRSIILELDAAIAFCCGSTVSGLLPPDLSLLAESLPIDWRKEYISLMGEVKGNSSILERMATLTGSLLEENYSQATLAIRNLSVETALTVVEKSAAEFGLLPDLNLSPVDRLAELINRQNFILFTQLGFQIADPDLLAVDRLHDLKQGMRILQGGDLHEQFWQWMDRFYYECYSPWRCTRLELMENQEKKVITILGKPESDETHPQIEWLPQKNPLRSIPELRQAVLDDTLRVFFWIDPFGLHDNWLLESGQVTVSCSEPGELVENFFSFTKDLAFRIQALSDPTRLLILRLIRNIDMTNTDMADYLGISRPTVSIHASILRKAGFIRSRQIGRIMQHEIVPGELNRLFEDLERFLDLPGKKK